MDALSRLLEALRETEETLDAMQMVAEKAQQAEKARKVAEEARQEVGKTLIEIVDGLQLAIQSLQVRAAEYGVPEDETEESAPVDPETPAKKRTPLWETLKRLW